MGVNVKLLKPKKINGGVVYISCSTYLWLLFKLNQILGIKDLRKNGFVICLNSIVLAI